MHLLEAALAEAAIGERRRISYRSMYWSALASVRVRPERLLPLLLFLCGKQIRQVIHVETEVGHATSANLIQFKMFGQMRRAMSTQSSELRHFALLASFLCLDKFDF